MDRPHPVQDVLKRERVVVLHEPFEHLFSPVVRLLGWMLRRFGRFAARRELTFVIG
jgi:hypothetical protein